MGIVSPSPEELLQNTIAFGVPSVVFFIMRLMNSGWVLRKFHVEDYLMCVTFCFYTSMLTFINISATFNTNLYPPEQEASILANPADVQNRVLGSKLVIPLEQSMLLSTWGVKTCIWLFLRRLCRQLPRFQLVLNCLIIYIWLGYLVIQICYYAIFCRPFNQYWAVPVKDEQCATYAHYSQVQMVFNISSDAALIVIPLCMFWIARLPLKRKLILMAVFSLAIFTIIAAVLNKVYNFLSPMTTTYQLWYIREASVAIWVGNLICCWQLFQKILKLRSFDDKSAGIIAQPEMEARRAEHPSQYSAGGSPKTNTWFARQRARMQEQFALAVESFKVVSNATHHHSANNVHHEDLRKNKPSGTDTSTMTGDTVVNEKHLGEPVTLITLNKDGDDTTHAIRYRVQEDIV